MNIFESEPYYVVAHKHKVTGEYVYLGATQGREGIVLWYQDCTHALIHNKGQAIESMKFLFGTLSKEWEICALKLQATVDDELTADATSQD